MDNKRNYNYLLSDLSSLKGVGKKTSNLLKKKKINNHISSWADLISIHPIAGEESVMAIENMGVILIGEMSSKNNLFNFQTKIYGRSAMS